jgi:hypothetical protein
MVAQFNKLLQLESDSPLDQAWQMNGIERA